MSVESSVFEYQADLVPRAFEFGSCNVCFQSLMGGFYQHLLFRVFKVFYPRYSQTSHKHHYIQDAVLLLGDYHHKHDEMEQKPWIPKQAARRIDERFRCKV